MKKRILALFAACSMITTAVAGLVQTAYAAGEPNIRIEVADGDTDTQKVLTFFYDVADGVDGVNTIQGKLSFDNSDVAINSINVTIDTPSSDFIVNNNPSTGLISFTHAYGTSSADGSFAIVNITVPEGADDITASFALETFEDTEYDEHAGNIGTVTATIPKKAAEPEKTYYNKGYVFTSSADAVAKTYTKLTINVIDTDDENKPGYAEVDLIDKLPTVSGSGEFTLFIKNIPTAYEVTSVELD